MMWDTNREKSTSASSFREKGLKKVEVDAILYAAQDDQVEKSLPGVWTWVTVSGKAFDLSQHLKLIAVDCRRCHWQWAQCQSTHKIFIRSDAELQLKIDWKDKLTPDWLLFLMIWQIHWQIALASLSLLMWKKKFLEGKNWTSSWCCCRRPTQHMHEWFPSNLRYLQVSLRTFRESSTKFKRKMSKNIQIIVIVTPIPWQCSWPSYSSSIPNLKLHFLSRNNQPSTPKNCVASTSSWNFKTRKTPSTASSERCAVAVKSPYRKPIVHRLLHLHTSVRKDEIDDRKVF